MPTWCNCSNHQTVQTTTLFLQCMMPTALVNIYKDMVYCCGEYLLGYGMIITAVVNIWYLRQNCGVQIGWSIIAMKFKKQHGVMYPHNRPGENPGSDTHVAAGITPSLITTVHQTYFVSDVSFVVWVSYRHFMGWVRVIYESHHVPTLLNKFHAIASDLYTKQMHDIVGWAWAGRVVVAPWLAEGVGRETRARIAMRTRNNILFVLQY